MANALDLFLVYSILKRLVAPFKRWKAFQAGVIDETGKILIEPKDRTEQQKRSLTSLDVLVLNMKKLLGKIPGGKSQFATFAAALFLLREHSTDEDKFKSYLTEEYDVNLHEFITNSIGAGYIALFSDPEDFYLDNEDLDDKADQYADQHDLGVAGGDIDDPVAQEDKYKSMYYKQKSGKGFYTLGDGPKEAQIAAHYQLIKGFVDKWAAFGKSKVAK